MKIQDAKRVLRAWQILTAAVILAGMAAIIKLVTQ